MNSGPNRDSKRCPESKLGQVHSVYTLDPGYAHAAHALHRVAGLALPCRRSPLLCRCAHAHASAPCGRPCVARRVAHRIVAQGTVSRAFNAVSWRSLHSILAPPPAVSRLSRNTTQRPSPARALQAVSRAGRPCRGLPRSYRGRPGMHHSAVSWPGAPAVSRYNALYRDSG